MLIFSAQLWNSLAKFICALSFVVIIIGAVFGLYELSFVKKAIVTDAMIIDLVEEERSSGEPLYAAVYVFEDEEGEKITIRSNTAFSPPVGTVGDSIKVLYHPDDPSRSMEDQFFSKWGKSVVIGGIGLFYFLIFGIIAILTGRRLEKNRIE